MLLRPRQAADNGSTAWPGLPRRGWCAGDIGLILMGASTFLVGCLPTYNQIGILAPILLVFLRLCQGFSASGEQAGAHSMTLEHAPGDRRAFFTSFTLSGTQAGLILGTAVFLPISWLP